MFCFFTVLVCFCAVCAVFCVMLFCVLNVLLYCDVLGCCIMLCHGVCFGVRSGGCGVVRVLRWFVLELEVCFEVCAVGAGFRCNWVGVFCCCFPFCKEVVGALKSGSVCLKLEKVVDDFPLLVLAGAFGAGLMEISC